MRLRELFIEATLPNVQVIEDMTAILISQLPTTFKENSIFILGRGELIKNSNRYFDESIDSVKRLEGLEDLYEIYKGTKFEKFIEKWNNASLIICNSIDFYNKIWPNHGFERGWLGYFSPRKTNPYIIVNLTKFESRFRKMIKTRTNRTFTDELDENTKFLSDHFSSISSILRHELTHLMQSVDFEDYYYSKKFQKYPYHERNIEIDAYWRQAILDFPPNKKYTPANYGMSVMDHLKTLVKFTPKQKQHFYRKTLRYYYDYMREDET